MVVAGECRSNTRLSSRRKLNPPSAACCGPRAKTMGKRRWSDQPPGAGWLGYERDVTEYVGRGLGVISEWHPYRLAEEVLDVGVPGRQQDVDGVRHRLHLHESDGQARKAGRRAGRQDKHAGRQRDE